MLCISAASGAESELADLPKVASPSALTHITKARPRRAKTKAPTRAVAPATTNIAEDNELTSSVQVDDFFKPAPMSASQTTPTRSRTHSTKSDKSDKPERPERPEKPEKPDRLAPLRPSSHMHSPLSSQLPVLSISPKAKVKPKVGSAKEKQEVDKKKG